MNDFRLYIPIVKVDKVARTVAGYATTEAIDKQNEIVAYDASKEAFASWQGNVREMHEPKAVGKAIEIIPDDEKKSVYVKAYISKGADETWEKVKEGILTGFSIGGNTLDKVVQIVKDAESNQARQVTRITKYRLNELSLVDNPANPEATFTLVKRADDGTLYQTEVVEDLQKVIITDTDTLLENEIKEYREKADGLARKVLGSEELEKLGDDDFGVVRKYVSPQGKLVKERLLPMPDKVHAHTALRKADSYPLSTDERERVHAKAKDILGTSHKEEDCTLCKNMTKSGGESNDMDATLVKELTGKIDSLVEQIGKLLKTYEDKNPEVGDAKEHPEDKAETEKADAAKPDAGVETQDPKGAYPAKGPVKSATKKQADEEKPEDKEAEETEKRDMAAEGHGNVNDVAEGASAEGEGVKTQDPKGAYPAKGPVKAADAAEPEEDEEDEEAEPAMKAKKASGADDLRKVVESLKKEVEALKKEPLPRKYRVEKTGDTEGEADLQKSLNDARTEIRKYVEAGKEVPIELRKKAEQLVDESLNRKFGNDSRKLM